MGNATDGAEICPDGALQYPMVIEVVDTHQLFKGSVCRSAPPPRKPTSESPPAPSKYLLFRLRGTSRSDVVFGEIYHWYCGPGCDAGPFAILRFGKGRTVEIDFGLSTSLGNPQPNVEHCNERTPLGTVCIAIGREAVDAYRASGATD